MAKAFAVALDPSFHATRIVSRPPGAGEDSDPLPPLPTKRTPSVDGVAVIAMLSSFFEAGWSGVSAAETWELLGSTLRALAHVSLPRQRSVPSLHC